MDFAGQVALVTGASRGIGREIALLLARRGANIVGHFHQRADLADTLREEVEQLGRRCILVRSDVSNPGEVEENIRVVEAEYGRLDMLINNAGYVESHRFPDAELDVIHKIIDINLKGAFNYIFFALKLLIKFKGRVVNIGSLNSRHLSAAGPAYAASKAGLTAMTTNLAHDLGPLGVRVNAVAPPLTQTDMGRWAQQEVQSKWAGIERTQRPADPEEIAEWVALFCSQSNRYVSGETLYMGGGYLEEVADG